MHRHKKIAGREKLSTLVGQETAKAERDLVLATLR
jgi:hypothetical protein